MQPECLTGLLSGPDPWFTSCPLTEGCDSLPFLLGPFPGLDPGSSQRRAYSRQPGDSCSPEVLVTLSISSSLLSNPLPSLSLPWDWTSWRLVLAKTGFIFSPALSCLLPSLLLPEGYFIHSQLVSPIPLTELGLPPIMNHPICHKCILYDA